jgi:hypothetical protein
VTVGLLPILAQTLALGVGDRTELRYLVNDTDESFQAETLANANLTLKMRNAEVGLSYAPRLLIAPLTLPPDNVTILQDATLHGTVSFKSKRSTLTLGQTATYSRTNYQLTSVSAAPTVAGPDGTDPGGSTIGGVGADPGATGGAGGATPPTQASLSRGSQTIEYVSLTSSVQLNHQLGRTTTMNEYAAYYFHKGLDEESRVALPRAHGVSGGVSLLEQVGRNDGLESIGAAQAVFSTRGRRAWTVGFSENWLHTWSRRTHTILGAGVAYARSVRGTLPAGSTSTTLPDEGGVFASAKAAFNYAAPAAGGDLSFLATATYEPQIDGPTTTIDPRLMLETGVTWDNRKRLTLSLVSTAILSTRSDDAGALNTFGLDARMAYQLGTNFIFESGARGAWTRFQSFEIVPPTVVLYVALAFAMPIAGRGPARR